MENCCCCECSDCFGLFPWKSKPTDILIGQNGHGKNGGKGANEESMVVVDYHFRGRVSSCTSLEGGDAIPPSSVEVVMQQPQPATQIASHKRSVSSLDSALLASATGILSQVLPGGRGPEAVYMQMSLTYEHASSSHESLLVVFLLCLRNYHSMFLPQVPSNTTGGHEGSPLLATGSLMGGSTQGPALMVRLSLDNPSSGVHFSSIQTRCSKNPVWKETITLDGVQSLKKALSPESHGSSGMSEQQKLIVVLYESNKYSRWAPVKMGSYPVKEIQIQGTHNLSIDLAPVIEDVHPYGEIKLCLCYNKSSNRVYCDILEVRSLLHWALTKKGEYFIKVQFFDKKKITKMKKTAAVKPDSSSIIPVFETIRAKIPLSSLDNLSIRLLVCDAKVIMSDSSLYYVTFGQDNGSGSAETTYWADFIRDIPASGKKQWFSLHQK